MFVYFSSDSQGVLNITCTLELLFQKVGQCEYELAQLREESDLEGGPSIQVLAVVDLDAIVTYGLKVS